MNIQYTLLLFPREVAFPLQRQFFLIVSGLQEINVGHAHAEALWECIDWWTASLTKGESTLLHMQARMRILEDAWGIEQSGQKNRKGVSFEAQKQYIM